MECPWCKHTFPPGTVYESVEKLEAALLKQKKNKASDGGRETPSVPGSPPVEQRGKLAPIASRILMKILWAARLARFDLLRAVCHLAQRVTKWTLECDRRLQRLVGYMA